MFESLVANLLNRFLGSYLENFDPKQLNIGIWGGDVKLTDLRLKKESLDKFKLPIDVKFGHLGVLTLQIPWSNLKGKPVQIVIEDLYLLASPIVLSDYNEEEEQKRQQAVKESKLKEVEEILEAKSEDLGKDLANETFAESLVTKIIDNLQVTIKNIHIRYEDESVLTEQPYTFGASLKELSAVSTNEDWEPSFISITQAFTRKLLKLNSLSLYMDTQTPELFSHSSREQILNDFKLLEPSEEYLLKPVTGSGKVTIHKSGTTNTVPHIESHLAFEEFGVELNSKQYNDILSTASQFQWITKTAKFRKFRPKTSPSEDPKEWFRYAAKCVLNEIHEKNYKWSWDYIKKRRDQRISYIKLWKLKLLRTISELDLKELKQLEWDLPLADIKLYRALARTELRKENKTARLYDTETSKKEEQSKGWFGGWWGGGANRNNNNNNNNNSSYRGNQETEKEKEQTYNADGEHTDLLLTEDQKKALYDTIDYDENATTATIELPDNYVTMKVNASLKKGGFVLKESNGANLAEVIFEGCSTQYLQRPNSFVAGFQMQEFRIEDGTNMSIYKHVVSVKEATGDDTNATKTPFFQVMFEQNPLDHKADSSLSAQLKSMTIFYSPKFVEKVISFFSPPTTHFDTVGAIMNAAEESIESITANTRMGLEYAIDEHKTINLMMDLQAPLLIMPLDPASFKSPVAILDAGHVSIVSNFAERSKIQEYKDKLSYTAADWKEVGNLLYDRFDLHLSDIEFYVGHTIKSTMEQLYATEDARPARVLTNLNLNLGLGVSILPDALNLAKFKLEGNIPKLAVNLNDFQYKTLMQIVDKAIPQSVASDADKESVFKAYGGEQDEKEFEFEKIHNGNNRKDVTTNADQKVFESNLSIDTIVLSLRRCISGKGMNDEPLIEILGDSLEISLSQTDLEMLINLSLLDFTVFDKVQKSKIAEFEKMMSSSIEKEKGQKLLSMKLARKRRTVLLKGENVDVFDQDIDMQIATVKVVVTRMTLLDVLTFSMNTFADPNAPPVPADELIHNSEEDDAAAPQKLNLSIKLESIVVIFNDDGFKLATATLETAQINMNILPESMDIEGRLGSITVLDNMSSLQANDLQEQKLIHMNGDNLAELSYKTYDVHVEDRPSELVFKTGALTINFVESSFNRLVEYFDQFLKMKAIYDGARMAALNEDTQLPVKLKFDILIKAPTVYFPVQQDNRFVANFGELYAKNDYKGANMKNCITAGIRNVSFASYIKFSNVVQNLNIVDNLDLTFDVEWTENYIKDVPTFVVQGKVPELKVDLTDMQIRLLNELSNSITYAFSVETQEESLEEVKESAKYANRALEENTQKSSARSGGKLTTQKDVQDLVTQQSAQKNPAVASSLLVDNETPPPDHKMVDLRFEVPLVALTLYQKTEDKTSVEDLKLSQFSLNRIAVVFQQNQNSQFDANLKVGSFVVQDVRKFTDSKFDTIIPAADGVKDQFVLTANSTGLSELKNITVILNVENPKVILALDYIFDLQSFIESSTHLEAPKKLPNKPRRSIVLLSQQSTTKMQLILKLELKLQETLDDENKQKGAAAAAAAASATTNIWFSVNVNRPSIYLLADDTRSTTEALVFKIEQLLVSKQNVISVASSNIGLYLTRMDDPKNSRYRLIDDFSVSFAADDKDSTDTVVSNNIQASIEPIVVRVSLRDIRLGLAIVQRANDMFAKYQSPARDGVESAQDTLKRRLSSISSTFSEDANNNGDDEDNKSITNAFVQTGSSSDLSETMYVSFGGLRFVLIGDVSELPVVDVSLKAFDLRALNWSTDLNAEVHLETHINIFNYANSCWQPLLEPWPVAILASRAQNGSNPKLLVEVVSRKLAEITVTSRTVALLSQIQSLLSTDEELKPRGQDYPFVIFNDTGYDLKIWTSGQKNDSETTLVYGESKPWAFEDWRTIRENLDADSTSALGISFLGKKTNASSTSTNATLSSSEPAPAFEPIESLHVGCVGEEIYVLDPPIDDVHSRLLVNIKLRDDNVKIITLRSTMLIENDADVPISIDIFADNKSTLQINSKESRSVPIDSVYDGKLRVKPVLHTEYGWSNEIIHWRDIMKRQLPLKCPPVSQNETNYFFQGEAIFDKDEPLAKVYPHLNLVISAPLEIENLLPYDFKYRLYDKNSRREWTGLVKKGVKSYVHVVSLKNLLLLSVEPDLLPGFGRSEFAIINGPKASEFSRELSLMIHGKNNLKLKIHYPRKHADSTSLKVTIYSPYVILNRSSLDLAVSDRGNVFEVPGKNIKGQELMPVMFSFDRGDDRGNRAMLKTRESSWSPPISFDAIGQLNQLKLQKRGEQTEISLGVTIMEGEGKYNLTKTVTIAPRYVFINRIANSLVISEEDSETSSIATTNELLPLYGFRSSSQTNVVLKFEESSKWTQPFCINDVGQLFVKIQDKNLRQSLLKVTMLLENATMFIQIEDANNQWPYSIKNYTNEEFYIYQNNPNINANGEVVRKNRTFKPIYYRIPPKSVMPYAYDFPNAIVKELIVRSRGRERAVNLSEIGNLRPI
ncbi:conserved hypothetical protein [Lodderomyces elongisporus NRRL YB-4239]|uniref:Vacuolar protein sorting-associated protein n=1 Tax=Lodderomyces elongisporus (strain ATCC 11503 / CBS 2605 / JCM 1781 / NBRC 1676 / NRRL YB-4239) TaxID=379508 RepID=A5E4H7_LODEL|nr:conserved hypothetical protein [Lodderomyces elongisporus NRRL YB-4239]